VQAGGYYLYTGLAVTRDISPTISGWLLVVTVVIKHWRRLTAPSPAEASYWQASFLIHHQEGALHP